MYTYRHPHPAVTVDVVLFSGEGPAREVLLIRRGAEPHKGDWALPGGFLDIDEGLEAAARRELLEETGLQAPALRQIGAYGEPARDPRERVISIAYAGELSAPLSPRPDDDAEDARWFRLASLPRLAFDHAQVIADAAQMLSRDGPP